MWPKSAHSTEGFTHGIFVDGALHAEIAITELVEESFPDSGCFGIPGADESQSDDGDDGALLDLNCHLDEVIAPLRFSRCVSELMLFEKPSALNLTPVQTQ